MKFLFFDTKKNILTINLAHDLAYGKFEDYVLNVFAGGEERVF